MATVAGLDGQLCQNVLGCMKGWFPMYKNAGVDLFEQF